MTSDVLTNLEAAKSLLVKTGWCQHAMARSIDGLPVDVAGKNAVSFCLYGAIRKTADKFLYSGPVVLQLEETLNKYGFSSIGPANDHPDTTFEMVLGWLDETIKNVEGVTTGGSVSCENVTGSVSAGGSISECRR